MNRKSDGKYGQLDMIFKYKFCVWQMNQIETKGLGWKITKPLLSGV